MFQGATRIQRKQDIPEVTEYLANNETFRNTVLNIEKKK